MSENYEKLKGKLKEIFQLDQADLDFGIYRIMNTKRDEVVEYLDNDLKPQVKEIISGLDDDSKSAVEEELNKAIDGAKAAEIDPETSPKVQKLRAQLKGSIDIDALEKEIFSDLYNFFSRYYEGGDFLSLRRYKEGVYAIPYEGEEVKLHWANNDQFYIKTSENFTNYSFKLSDDKRVHFRIVKAGTEQNNNKAQEGKDRRFILASEEEVSIENGELIIPFEYKADSEKRKQKDINEAIVETLKAEKTVTSHVPELFQEIDKASKGKWTVLEKHLNDYTAKNEFDYFIHKDLGGFLKRELDFFIKNEILYLDDIIDQKPKDFENRLAKLKALKTIGHKIIAFLSQLEEFQKKLWLKKKFVVETNWCITLDRIPEEFYPEIVANEAQREEWVKLFAIDELTGVDAAPSIDDIEDFDTQDNGKYKYAEPLTIDFLKANPYLVLDTALFSSEFKRNLISKYKKLDEETSGVLIQSDNFQALELLKSKYKKSVDMIYIDPPYNTGADGFSYKDTYKTSSWNSMFLNRLDSQISLMKESTPFFVSLDNNQVDEAKLILKEKLDYIDTITVKTKVSGVSGSHHGKSLKNSLEYLLLSTKNKSEFCITDQIYDLHELYEYIENMEEEGKSWKYTQVLISEGEKKHITSFKDGYGQNIQVYKHTDYDFCSISQLANEKFDGNLKEAYYNYTDRIFDTQPAQSSIRSKVIEASKQIEADLISIDYIPTSGRNQGKRTTLYYKGNSRRLITWLSDITLQEDGVIYKKENSGNLWTDIKYNNIKQEGDTSFPNGKKPISLVLKTINMTLNSDGLILDYCAGSATTAHATIEANLQNKLNHKYILVEMGEHFDAATMRRVQKVIYSRTWTKGKPNRNGLSHCMKYIRLESYEDALNNLALEREDEIQGVLETNDKVKEQYLLNYMLDTESKGSVLNIKAFERPFDYQLLINKNDDTRTRSIDLVETFNYLIGLYVNRMRFINDVYVVNGETREGEQTLILWRNVEEIDAEKLDKWFEENCDELVTDDLQTIYVNGDSTLQNLAKDKETWSVKSLEETFHRLMFNEDTGL